MLVRVWEYDVVPGREQEFEEVYGADGAWARLFARSPGFRGVDLYSDVRRRSRYVTIDRFDDEQAWLDFLAEHGAEYAELDRNTGHLTLSETELA